MRRPAILTCLVAWLICLGPSPAAGETLVIYEAPPGARSLHPLRLGESVQGLHLAALTTEHLGQVDVATNTLVLPFFQAPSGASASRIWDLQLIPGLKWSDGAPVTGEDVAGSFDRLSAWAGRAGSPLSVRALRRSLFLVQGVEAVGSSGVQVRFSSPVRGEELASLLAPLPLMPARISDEALERAGAPTVGPFSVEEVGAEVTILAANPYYHRGAPRLERIEVILADADDLRVALATPGLGEVALYVPPDTELGPDVSLRMTEARRFAYLGFNRRPGSRFAAQPGLRLAVARMVDRQDLLDVIPSLPGERTPVAGPYAPGTALATRRPLDRSSLQEAEAALIELGYRRTGDRWRDAANRPLKLRLRYHEALPGGARVAAMVAEQLDRAGISTSVEAVSAEAFLALLDSPTGDYDLMLHEFTLDESEGLTEVFHTGGRYNYLGYANPEVDRRLTLERQAQLGESRRLYRAEIEARFEVDPPAIFLWRRKDVIALRSDVTAVPPLDPYFVLRDVYRWRLGSPIEDEEEAPPPAPTPTPTPTPAPTPAPAAAPADDAAPATPPPGPEVAPGDDGPPSMAEPPTPAASPASPEGGDGGGEPPLPGGEP